MCRILRSSGIGASSWLAWLLLPLAFATFDSAYGQTTWYEVANRTQIQCQQAAQCFQAYAMYVLNQQACTTQAVCISGPLNNVTSNAGNWNGYLGGYCRTGGTSCSACTNGGPAQGQCLNVNSNLIAETGTPPSAVTQCAGRSGYGTVGGQTNSAPAYARDSDNCVYSGTGPSSGVCTGLSATNLTCSVQYTGATDAFAGQGPATAASNCVTGPAGTACVQTSGSGADQCGTMNGDQVCPSALPPGTCVSYNSGGVACSAAGPPSSAAFPSTEVPQASGGNAPPSAVVTNTSTTSNYYSSTTIAGQTGTTAAASGGVNVGNGGSGTGSGGSQSGGCGASGQSPCSTTDANAAADGNCSAGDCSVGGNPMPTYDWSSDSWSGATTSFWNAVAAGPIGSAVSGISANWPSGASCPAETVAITTLNMTADYGTPLCNVWENSAVPVLSAVMLAVWSIVAVFIFLSA